MKKVLSSFEDAAGLVADGGLVTGKNIPHGSADPARRHHLPAR